MLFSNAPALASSTDADDATASKNTKNNEVEPVEVLIEEECRILDYVDKEVFEKGNHVAQIREEETLDTYVFFQRGWDKDRLLSG